VSISPVLAVDMKLFDFTEFSMCTLHWVYQPGVSCWYKIFDFVEFSHCISEV